MTDADGIIYSGALAAAWICLAMVIVVLTVLNMFFSESESAIDVDNAKGQLLGSGLDGLLRMFHSKNTSAQLSVEDVEKIFLEKEYAAQYAKNKLYWYAMQQQTNPYFFLSDEEEEETRTLQALAYEFDNGDFHLTSRRTKLLQAVTFVLWFCDVFMFAVDLGVLVNATNVPVLGGINAYLGFSLLVGVGSAIFPPWFIYQKYFLRLVQKFYD